MEELSCCEAYFMAVRRNYVMNNCNGICNGDVMFSFTEQPLR